MWRIADFARRFQPRGKGILWCIRASENFPRLVNQGDPNLLREWALWWDRAVSNIAGPVQRFEK